MTELHSIVAVVVGSIVAMGALLVLATMMEQWMKRDPLAPRPSGEGQAALVGGPVLSDVLSD